MLVCIMLFFLLFLIYTIQKYYSNNYYNDDSCQHNHSTSVKNAEYFGVDTKPFEPDNSRPNFGPWDDIDYIKPEFIV